MPMLSCMARKNIFGSVQVGVSRIYAFEEDNGIKRSGIVLIGTVSMYVRVLIEHLFDL